MTPDHTERYDAIIFDCDGTLADTMPAHYVAWVETLNRYGIAFPEDRFYSLGGWKTDAIIVMLADEHGVKVDAQVVAHEKELAFFEHLHNIGPIEPVLAVAQAHRGLMPMAVATGSVRESVDKVLRQIALHDWFDAIVSADEVTQHKPHPETYLEAARRMKVDPTRCVAYEDAIPGIESARAAGMDVIDVRELLKSV